MHAKYRKAIACPQGTEVTGSIMQNAQQYCLLLSQPQEFRVGPCMQNTIVCYDEIFHPQGTRNKFILLHACTVAISAWYILSAMMKSFTNRGLERLGQAPCIKNTYICCDEIIIYPGEFPVSCQMRQGIPSSSVEQNGEKKFHALLLLSQIQVRLFQRCQCLRNTAMHTIVDQLAI